MSQERAERSSTLWEDYTRRLKSKRVDGFADDSASDNSNSDTRGEGRGEGERDGGREGNGGGEEEGSGRGTGEGEGVGVGDAVDRVTMQDVEMLYYLQEDDDLDSHENNSNSYSNSYSDGGGDGDSDSDDGVFEREYANSKFSFTFDGSAGAVLEEGEYMDEREKDQVIESRSRKSCVRLVARFHLQVTLIRLQSRPPLCRSFRRGCSI